MKAFIFPTVGAAVVATLATLLLGILARSPYTHTNLAPQFDPGYTRTEQAVVGPAAAYHGSGVVPSFGTSSLEVRGKVLFAVRGCASCHGLEGNGGVVGPSVTGFDLEKVREKVRQGPVGMPEYAAHSLADDDLAAIAAFLAMGEKRPAKQDSASQRKP